MYGFIDRSRIGYIEEDRLESTRRGRVQRFGRLLVPNTRIDIEPRIRKPQCGSTTDTARGARDQRGFIRQLIYSCADSGQVFLLRSQTLIEAR